MGAKIKPLKLARIADTSTAYTPQPEFLKIKKLARNTKGEINDAYIWIFSCPLPFKIETNTLPNIMTKLYSITHDERVKATFTLFPIQSV